MSSDLDGDVVINVDGLSKVYRIYRRPHHRLLQSFNSRKKYFVDFAALSGVSFSVKRGETVGIIGKNGSGKSTLLQLICGVIAPSAGEVEVRGRVAAILELGAGFNSEFSGRENVILGAALLGMSESEAREVLPQIIAFSELQDFIDQPVKTYSSGMYIRLAFSLAISVRPDILVIDEALAVGDEAFQRKCFGRLEKLKAEGCTLLFVSHSAGSILHLCDRAILLHEGRMLLSGAPKTVVSMYQRLLYAPESKRDAILAEIDEMQCQGVQLQLARIAEATTGEDATPVVELYETAASERFDPGMISKSLVELVPRGVEIRAVCIKSESGDEVNVLAPGRIYKVCYEVAFRDEARSVNLGMMIKSVEGIELFGMTTNSVGDSLSLVRGGATARVEFRFRNLFLPGTYFLNVGCHGIGEDGEVGFLHRILDAYMFRVDSKASSRLVGGYYDLSEEPACMLNFNLVADEGKRRE